MVRSCDIPVPSWEAGEGARPGDIGPPGGGKSSEGRWATPGAHPRRQPTCFARDPATSSVCNLSRCASEHVDTEDPAARARFLRAEAASGKAASPLGVRPAGSGPAEALPTDRGSPLTARPFSPGAPAPRRFDLRGALQERLCVLNGFGGLGKDRRPPE